MQNARKPQYENQGTELRLTFKNRKPERSRAYTFPGGDLVEIKNVTEVSVSRHGYHFIATKSGVRHVVRPNWLVMTLDSTGEHEAPEEYREKD